jgi:hypothetical protein
MYEEREREKEREREREGRETIWSLFAGKKARPFSYKYEDPKVATARE